MFEHAPLSVGSVGKLVVTGDQISIEPSSLQSLALGVLRYRPSALGQATCQIEFEPQETSCSTRYRASRGLDGRLSRQILHGFVHTNCIKRSQTSSLPPHNFIGRSLHLLRVRASLRQQAPGESGLGEC